MQVSPIEVYDLLSLLGLPPAWHAQAFLDFFAYAAKPNPSHAELAHMASLFRAVEQTYGAVSVEEVFRGLRPGEEEVAHRLFSALVTADLGAPEGELAGTWRRQFARRGRTLSQADCLVAAAAVGAGARLATGNPKDFPMRELVVEHWPAGA